MSTRDYYIIVVFVSVSGRGDADSVVARARRDLEVFEVEMHTSTEHPNVVFGYEGALHAHRDFIDYLQRNKYNFDWSHAYGKNF